MIEGRVTPFSVRNAVAPGFFLFACILFLAFGLLRAGCPCVGNFGQYGAILLRRALRQPVTLGGVVTKSFGIIQILGMILGVFLLGVFHLVFRMTIVPIFALATD
ncbi:MAG: hypothetical protein ABSE22_16470 [Xanthobacteraceae bacterium]|jgi:hypothetical protein